MWVRQKTRSANGRQSNSTTLHWHWLEIGSHWVFGTVPRASQSQSVLAYIKYTNLRVLCTNVDVASYDNIDIHMLNHGSNIYTDGWLFN